MADNKNPSASSPSKLALSRRQIVQALPSLPAVAVTTSVVAGTMTLVPRGIRQVLGDEQGELDKEFLDDAAKAMKKAKASGKAESFQFGELTFQVQLTRNIDLGRR